MDVVKIGHYYKTIDTISTRNLSIIVKVTAIDTTHVYYGYINTGYNSYKSITLFRCCYRLLGRVEFEILNAWYIYSKYYTLRNKQGLFRASNIAGTSVELYDYSKNSRIIVKYSALKSGYCQVDNLELVMHNCYDNIGEKLTDIRQYMRYDDRL